MKALALAVLLAAPAGAAETAAFLDIGVGARAIGLGGAYSALADDSDAVFWNPAGLARQEKKGAAFSHAALGVSNRQEFISYAHPTSRATFGGAFTYLNYGSIDGRDAAGVQTSPYTASDTAFALAAGLKGEAADVGLAVKYVGSHIGQTQAQSAAVDAGLRREQAWGTGKAIFAATMRNLGPGLKYQDERNDLPLRAGVGAAYRFASGHAVAAEVQNGPRGAGSEGGVGGEFKVYEGVCLRTGWTSKGSATGGSGFDAVRGLTLGVGLRREGFGIDYAAQAAGELGNTHRFTLSARW